MARQPRFLIPNQPHHIIQRGNNRQIIFCATTDYHHYLEKLLCVSEKYNCEIHAYVLMSNHVHLLATPLKEDGISQMMQTLGTYYARYFNYHYQRTGTLFEGRYKSIPIDTEQYLLKCMRYIELNPVRAQMVHTPSEYKWSSYIHNAFGKKNILITPHNEYKHLGKNQHERNEAYKHLFISELDQKTLEEIRESTNKNYLLGNQKFKEEMAEKLNRRVMPLARGGDRKSSIAPPINK